MSHPIPPPPLDLTPARSTTDLPSKHGHHQHHHIHRPHRSHHHHHRDKSVPQSAILPSSTSNLFRSDNSLGDLLSPLTKVGSRFESHHSKGQSSAQNEPSGEGAGPGAGHSKRLAQEEADEALKKETEARERRLWKEVERKTGERGEGDDSTHLDSFNKATADLSCSMKSQLQQLEHTKFEEQKRRAVGLERRLKGAREKVRLLEDRLKGAGEQVEQVEGTEKEKGKIRRWRWSCLWLACGGVFILLMLLLVTGHGSVELQARPEEQKAIWSEDNPPEPQEPRELNTTTKIDEWAERVGTKANKARVRTTDEWDSRMRMLEEL
ncbi:MAG: hypothetical protein Q9226_005289 [Calogaya cf. arnoldii]